MSDSAASNVATSATENRKSGDVMGASCQATARDCLEQGMPHEGSGAPFEGGPDQEERGALHIKVQQSATVENTQAEVTQPCDCGSSSSSIVAEWSMSLE